MKTPFFALLILLAFGISACSGSDASLEPSVLLREDFSNPASGWDRTKATEGLTDYQDGGYRILVNETNYSIWANPNQSSYTDVQVEVDAQKLEAKMTMNSASSVAMLIRATIMLRL